MTNNATTIELLADDSVAITVFNAICRHTKSDDILSKFNIAPGGDNTTAVVELFVNGVSVPLLPTLSSYFKKFQDKVSEEASQRLLKMIDGTGVGGIVDTIDKLSRLLDDAQSSVKSEIRSWMQSKGHYTGHLNND